MITTGAILHGDRDALLAYSGLEHPLALQVGGDDPEALAECARIAEGYGYDEVNLNVGCPSARVQNGSFGACLMAHPERVAAAVAKMKAAVSVPVTVKHRIGIDGLERYEDMRRFVDIVSGSGADRFSVHARIAILGGLSPKENRTVPPLRYAEVHRLKVERPALTIEINGGIRDLDHVEHHLEHVDGVMIGRAAYEAPYVFARADRRIFDDDSRPVPSRAEVVEACCAYADRHVRDGGRLHAVSRHLLPLFAGLPGGRKFRRHISERAPRPEAGSEVLREALAFVSSPPSSAEAQGSHPHGEGVGATSSPG